MNMPPKVLFDGSVFCNNHQKGIQRYLRELLVRLHPPGSVLIGDAPVAPLPSTCRTLMHPRYGRAPKYNFIKRIYRHCARFFPPRELSKFDLFHSVYFTPTPTARLPSVVMLYDMIVELLPGLCNVDTKANIAMKHKALRRADAIITISEATRTDLASIYPDLASKATVVHLGAEHIHQPPPPTQAAQRTSSEDPCALYVGHRSGYKNFSVLISAMKQPGWPNQLALKVVGPFFSPAERKMIERQGLSPRVSYAGSVSDDDLARLYQRAEVFVFPSLLEGFGFPLLEAQIFGVPVVASKIPVFAEVGGEAFEPFDAHDPASLAQAVARAIEPRRAAALVEMGLKNALRFSWDATARRTERVWQSVSRSA